MTVQRQIIEALQEAGIRDRVKVMVGGAPVTRNGLNPSVPMGMPRMQSALSNSANASRADLSSHKP